MKPIVTMSAVMALGAASATFAEDWYPSKHGADDRIGAANHMSPETVKAAAGLITQGKVYRLGVVTGRTTPAYPGRSYNLVLPVPGDGAGEPVGTNRIVGNDDLLIAFLGIGTQIDGLGHIGIDHRYYNGLEARSVVSAAGLTALGVQDIPPIVGRGVLLDMAKLLGADPLPAGTAFNRAEIDRAAEAAGVTIGTGDIVLFHTGYLKLAASDPAAFIATQPGLGKEGAAYLASLGVVAVGADTAALEVVPFETEGEFFPVHQELLTKNGVYILENVDTAELAADGATAFFFALGAPRFEGTVQGVVNPIAIR